MTATLAPTTLRMSKTAVNRPAACAAVVAVKGMPIEQLRDELRARRSVSVEDREEAQRADVSRRAKKSADRLRSLGA